MIIFTSIYFFFTLCFFLFFNKLSSVLNVYDVPNERKLHEKQTSLAGGVYLFVCIYFYLIFALIFKQNNIDIFFSINTEYFNFFIIALIFFLVGFVDDKKNISSNFKIIIFFVLILSAVSIDPKLNVKILHFSFTEKKLLLQNFSIIFTIFCVFLFINALNMYDGSNGQLGIYVIVCISYLSYKTNSYFIFSIVFPLILFIYLNLKNITFSGNSGSYFLGFFLSYIVLKIYNFEKIYLIKSDEIVLMMFYPVIDLIRLFFSRVYNNKNPFSADRNHIHHIFYEKKYSNKKIQIILLSINALPLLIYEVTQINIFFFFLINIFVYYLIVSKKKLLFF
jgi:UDP-GlcNAc:undecaprenyl-phosphate/decaprenyl-phosphate GlcNAc-1-phosphate transferase